MIIKSNCFNQDGTLSRTTTVVLRTGTTLLRVAPVIARARADSREVSLELSALSLKEVAQVATDLLSPL